MTCFISGQDSLNNTKSEAFLNSLRDEPRNFKQLPPVISPFQIQTSSILVTPSDSSPARLPNTSVITSKPSTTHIKPTASSAFSAYGQFLLSACFFLLFFNRIAILVAGPGAIGMERRHKSGTLSATNSNSDFSNGWPPSSLPPEPPTPSPPNDFSVRLLDRFIYFWL